MKRIADVVFATIFLLAFPLTIASAGYYIIINAIKVLAGVKTWVGYTTVNHDLPALKPGVISVTGLPIHLQSALSPRTIARLDFLYAKHYDWIQDLKIILKNYKKLGSR